MNRKVLGWVVVLLASLTTAAAAAVWLIVAGAAPGLILAVGLPSLPTLALGASALMAMIACIALLRDERAPRRTHTRATFIARRPGPA
ncbi:MAG: hypothetical protein ACOH14_02115 [Rhodoglobus sp.]